MTSHTVTFLRQWSETKLRFQVFLLFSCLFPSCRFADMTDDIPSPHLPVHLISSPALSPVLFKSHSLSILFSVVLSSLFSGISVLNTFLTVCSSSFLITCPLQFSRLYVIVLEACVTSFWGPWNLNTHSLPSALSGSMRSMLFSIVRK